VGSPKESSGLCRNEVDTILVCPIVDLELFLIRYATENDDLGRVENKGREW